MRRSPAGLLLPPLPALRPRPAGRRRSVLMGLGGVLEPDGTVATQAEDWTLNMLHDAGERSMLNVYLREQPNPAKYLALLNDATIAETDGTIGDVTETHPPGTAGYTRQQVFPADWTDDGLIAGDVRYSAAEKRFGPATAAWTMTHAALTTTATTGAGILIASLPLAALTNVAADQSFAYVFRWTQQ